MWRFEATVALAVMFKPDDEVLQKLVCTKCQNSLSFPPVYIGHDGTSICGRCSEANQEAGVDLVRNEAYEASASTLLFPCQYKHFGCDVLTSFANGLEHESRCLLRPSTCFANEESNCTCEWRGRRADFLQHYKENHCDLVLDGPRFEMELASSRSRRTMLLEHDGNTFVLQIEYNASSFSCDLRYLSDRPEKRISYSLKFVGDQDDVYFTLPPSFASLLDAEAARVRDVDMTGVEAVLKSPPKIYCELLIQTVETSKSDKLFLCPNCDWHGKQTDIFQHIRSNHDVTKALHGSTHTVSLEWKTNSTDRWIMFAHDGVFRLTYDYFNNDLAVYVRYLGLPEHAKHYQYKTELQNFLDATKNFLTLKNCTHSKEKCTPLSKSTFLEGNIVDNYVAYGTITFKIDILLLDS